MTSNVISPPRQAAATGPFVAGAVVANLTLVATFVTDGGPGFPLIGVLAAPFLGLAAFAIVRRPQRGLLLLAALLPYNGLRAVVPFPAGWKEALVLVTLAATFLAPSDARGRPGRSIPHWWPILGAFFGLALASAGLVGGTQGLVGLKIGFFFSLTAVILWRCPFDARDRDQLITILMVNGVVTAGFGLVQQLFGPERLVAWGWEYNTNVRFAGSYLRSFSTFNQSFPFSLFLMLVILIALPCALEQPRRLRNQLFLVALPLLVLGMGASLTRAGWLGLVVGLVYLALARVLSLRAILAHVAVLAAVALVFLGSYSSVFLSTSSTEERYDLWRQNLTEIAAHPIGEGIGASGSAAEKTAEIRGEEKEETFQPDNYYFKTTLELGVVGLWLFVLLLVTSFSAAHVAARILDGTDAALASGVAASVLAAAAVSVVATYFEIFPMDAYFWLLLATVATCVHESR